MAGVYSGRSLKRGSGKVFLPKKGGRVLGNTKKIFTKASKFDNIPPFRKNASKQMEKTQAGRMKGLNKIRKKRNVGTVNNYLWDKSM